MPMKMELPSKSRNVGTKISDTPGDYTRDTIRNSTRGERFQLHVIKKQIKMPMKMELPSKSRNVGT
jgi:hypothetical protein